MSATVNRNRLLNDSAVFQLILLFAGTATLLHAQGDVLQQWAAGVAVNQLATRTQAIGAIQTVGAAEARKSQVNTTLNNLLGGLPTYTGPLNAQVTGIIDRGTFRIEKILLESMPNIRVSANLYIPQSSGALRQAVLLPSPAAPEPTTGSCPPPTRAMAPAPPCLWRGPIHLRARSPSLCC